MKKLLNKYLKSLKSLSRKKTFWLYSSIVAVGLVVGVWALFFRKKKTTTSTTTTANKSTVVKVWPDHTLLFLDLLEGFGEADYSVIDGKITAPYLEKQMDFCATEGLDGILVAIPIDHVYRSGDEKADWSVVDYVLGYAAQKGLFVVNKLRIEPYKSYLYPSFNVDDFTTDNSSVKFSSNFWTLYAKQFVEDYKAQYTDRHNDGSILCVFPTSNIEQEWGYTYDLPVFEGSISQRYKDVNRVMQELATALAPLKVGVDVGGFYDGMAANYRGTADVTGLTAASNIVCLKDNAHISANLLFDHALLLSYSKAKNGFAMVEHTNSPSGQVTDNLIEDFKQSIDLGMDIAGFAFTYDEAGHQVVRTVIEALKQSGHYRRPKPQWAPVGTFTYTTSELRSNNGYEGPILNRFLAQVAANGGKLPKVNVTNDL